MLVIKDVFGNERHKIEGFNDINQTNEEETIKYLRKQIPSFKCKKDCHECCGVVMFSKWEWDQITNKKYCTDLSNPICPYVDKNGCEIYEDRPIICRLFGTVKKMKCPHKCKPKKFLSEKQEKEIVSLYCTCLEKNLLGHIMKTLESCLSVEPIVNIDLD